MQPQTAVRRDTRRYVSGLACRLAVVHDNREDHRPLTYRWRVLPEENSHLDESLDFQVIFEYFLLTHSDVDIRSRHVANVAGYKYGKREAARFIQLVCT